MVKAATEFRARVGQNVRALRKLRGFSQEGLGERSGLSCKFIGEIERGVGNPTVDTIVALARALSIDVAMLFEQADSRGGRRVPFPIAQSDYETAREALNSLGGLLTSALLRLVLGEPSALDEIQSYDHLVSSELIAVESCRTIDRLRLQGSLSTEEAASRLLVVTEWLEAIDLVLLRPPVLSRASGPLPTPLGTLDALHLATALIHSRGPLCTTDGKLRAAALRIGMTCFPENISEIEKN